MKWGASENTPKCLAIGCPTIFACPYSLYNLITTPNSASSRWPQSADPVTPCTSCTSPSWTTTSARRRFQRYRAAIGPRQLCAGGQKGRGACAGDAGGPLMAAAGPGQPRAIVGVVSFGPARCGTEGVPDVYTRVADYEEWIEANVRS